MLNEVIFYTLEKTIKRYRQFAQANIDRAGIDITIDQWLVLNVIREQPEAGQTDIAERVFKDQASVARIIDLLVKKGLLARTPNATDRRKMDMQLTATGEHLMVAVAPTIRHNRETALQNLSAPEVEQLKQTLEAIFSNCLPFSSEHKQQIHHEHT